MEQIKITGGARLHGAVETPAAKNSILPLLAASLLCREPCVFRAVPRLTDVGLACDILEALGTAAHRRGECLVVEPGPIRTVELPEREAKGMRASVLFAAPVLARAGRVRLPLPGGCNLGPRPIDIHLSGLEAMGAKVLTEPQAVCLEAPHGLHGADFTLRLPSVGATESLLMAAACAKGTTLLRNVAREPEIENLALFLQECGAAITGAGTATIAIQGVPALRGCSHRPVPDRIYAATMACAVACAGGAVKVKQCAGADLPHTLLALEKMGCKIWPEPEGFTIKREGPLQGIGFLQTAPWPGLATDAAPLLAAAALYAAGNTTLRDTVFERRFACADGFAAMGAACTQQGNSLSICGGTPLHGACVVAPDLRGGAALVLAALGAKGQTTIQDTGHIPRGYQNLVGELAALGAQIK